MPKELLVIALYGLIVAVVYPLMSAVRDSFWEHSRKPVDWKRDFVYGLTYTRDLTGLACLGGIVGVYLCAYFKVAPEFSIFTCPILPIFVHVSTTKEKRWTKLFYR